MTYAIDIDRTICGGYGNCVEAAHEVFDIDADDIAFVRPGRPQAGDAEAVAEAADDCPVQAIRLRSV